MASTALVALAMSATVQARYFVGNSDFEKSPWLAEWSVLGSIIPAQETSAGISSSSMRIPAHLPPVATSATSGVAQDFRDPGYGNPTTLSDVSVGFDFRLLGVGGADRNLTFALKNGGVNVIALMIQNGVLQAFDGASWRPLHTTAQYHFNSTTAVYRLTLQCSGLGTPAAKYDLSFSDPGAGGLTFTDLTYLTNSRAASILFNNAYTGTDFLIDNVTLDATSLTGYTAWVESIPGLADPTHTGDPDGDGMKNIVEYVLGEAPGEQSDSPISMPEVSGDLYRFNFRRWQQASADTTQTFQYSKDLIHWTDLPLGTTGSPMLVFSEPENGFQKVEVTLPATETDDGKLFGRLKAEAASAAVDGVISVSSAFEGGSARVMSINQTTRTAKINPAGDNKRGWPCWWYLRVDGLNIGETFTLQVDASGMTEASGAGLSPAWALPTRISVSTDDINWSQSAPGSIGSTGTWQIPVTAKSMWFAWGPPFTPSDSAQLVNEIAASSPHAEAFELCKSNEGRSVPALRVTQDRHFNDSSRRYVWINARAHAWESGSSWSCKGLVEWLVSEDPRAEALRRRAIVLVVPILDIDNTFLGHGGKEGLPQDHNRDWSDAPFFAEVRAAQALISTLKDTGRLDVFLEMHNPGPTDLKPIFYIPAPSLLSTQGSDNLNRFMAAGSAEITDPMVLDTNKVVVDSNYHPRWRYVSFNWVCAVAKDYGTVGLCLEVPWNTPSASTAGCMTLGRQQGLAIERYLRVP